MSKHTIPSKPVGTAAIAAVDPIPYCVDLDGTLVKTDTLIEALLILLKQNPLLILSVPFWVLHGKPYFKQQLADRVALDPATLPYQQSFLADLEAEAANGRQLLLVTASHVAYAKPVADHVGIFAEVHANDGSANLNGRSKLEYLVERFGERGFDYAGNARVDVAIFKKARRGIVVNPSSGVVAAAGSSAFRTYEDRPSYLKSAFKQLRVVQWAKNSLLVVAPLLGHRLQDPQILQSLALAVLAFCLCASSVYVLNDMLDLAADRRHHRKNGRPFAAGNLDLRFGLMSVPLLLLGSLIPAAILGPTFLAVLVGYAITTLAYSFRLKRMVLIDVVVLAALYLVRIEAGAVATGVVVSPWLATLAMFFFSSLALAKRQAELIKMHAHGRTHDESRGYHADDRTVIGQLGTAAGYVAVLVLALYLQSDMVRQMYRHPQWLWLLCPLLLLWISRAWLLTQRGQMHDDPVVFVVKDRFSYGVLAVAAIVFGLAIR